MGIKIPYYGADTKRNDSAFRMQNRCRKGDPFQRQPGGFIPAQNKASN